MDIEHMLHVAHVVDTDCMLLGVPVKIQDYFIISSEKLKRG